MHPVPFRRFSTSVVAPTSEDFTVERFNQTPIRLTEDLRQLKTYRLLRRKSSILSQASEPPSKPESITEGNSPEVQGKKREELRFRCQLVTQTSLPTLPPRPKYMINIIGAEGKHRPSVSAVPSANLSPPKPNPQAQNVKTDQPKKSEKHLVATFQALDEARRLTAPGETMLNLYRMPLSAPRKPYTVVFDLEETLVHICDRRESGQVFLQAVDISFNVRPYALQCLRELREEWEIIVFASSPKARVEPVLNYLDPERNLIDVKLYQENSLPVDHCFVKDLRLLAGRDIKKTVIIDNNARNFAFQVDNGVPIKAWRNSNSDVELMHLTSFLKEIRRDKDVRFRLRKTFDLKHFCDDYEKTFASKERKSSM